MMLYTFGCDVALRPRWSASGHAEAEARTKAALAAGITEDDLTLESVGPVPESEPVTRPARAYYDRYSAYEDGD